MIDYHKVTKNISINLLIFNKLRHSIALFFTQFKTASYAQKGMVKITLPKFALQEMEMNGDLSLFTGLNNIRSDINVSGIIGTEYRFSPSVKDFIVNLFTPLY